MIIRRTASQPLQFALVQGAEMLKRLSDWPIQVLGIGSSPPVIEGWGEIRQGEVEVIG